MLKTKTIPKGDVQESDIIGKQTIFIPAGAFSLPLTIAASNGTLEADTDPEDKTEHSFIRYSGTEDQQAYFKLMFPRSFFGLTDNRPQSFDLEVYFIYRDGTPADFVLELLAGRTSSTGGTASALYSSLESLLSATIEPITGAAAEKLFKATLTITSTITNDFGISYDDMITFYLKREATNAADIYTESIDIEGVKLIYETTAATDSAEIAV